MGEFKQSLKEKILFFNKRRYDFVLILLVIGYFNISSSLTDALALVNKKDAYIEKISAYVTYITDTGVVKQYEKEKFDVYKQKLNVADELSKYLIQSAYDLTDNYKNTFFENENQLFKSSETFKKFFINFVMLDNSGNASEKQIKQYGKAKNDWEQIMRWYRLAVNQNNLPHSIDPKESDIDVSFWESKDNEFKIVFKIPLLCNSLNKNNVVDKGIAYAQISAEGYYNLLDKTIPNPYGMKFTNLELVLPTIDHSLIK